MSIQVIKNEFGFFQLKDTPTDRELKNYYTKKYYQEGKGPYDVKYSAEEIQFFYNKIEQKYLVINDLLNNEQGNNSFKFLDVGCGEGWALKYFSEKYWKVLGLDYTKHACECQNPDYIKYVRDGELLDSIDGLFHAGERFHVILLDNVLEHVVSPLALLEACETLAEQTGVLVVDVPNDFSTIQTHLLENQHISKKFWVVRPDHISYFNKEGLTSICDKAGWLCAYLMGDYPIDFNLFNPNTNYIKNPTVGKSCHKERVAIENMLHSISPKKTNTFYRALADMGLGRNITGFFQRKNMAIR